MLSHDQPITHLSMNSQAAVLFEIRKQESVHWLLGLRQAELTINDRESALRANQKLLRRQLRELGSKARRLASLEKINFPVNEQIDEMENLKDDLEEATIQIEQKLPPLVRDCQMELSVAISEKARILKSHPEAESLSFEELQQQFSGAALRSKQSRFIAAAAWASQNGLPEGAGQLLFDIPDQEREIVMAESVRLLSGVQATAISVNVAQYSSQLLISQQQQLLTLIQSISQISPDIQEIILSRAISSVNPHSDKTLNSSPFSMKSGNAL